MISNAYVQSLATGKSLEIIPTGTTRLRVGRCHYTWYAGSSYNEVLGDVFVFLRQE